MTALIDGLFSGQAALHASGGRLGFSPARVRWNRDTWRPSAHAHNLWVTDGQMFKWAQALSPEFRVNGWLLEPRGMHPENYLDAEKAITHLHRLVTHDMALLNAYPEVAVRFPMGGTRLHSSDWRFQPTSAADGPISLILSAKHSLRGHRIRHELARRRDSSPVPIAIYSDDPALAHFSLGGDKRLALAPWHGITLAIEPTASHLWFSEHLLDAFLTGTFPVWWGRSTTIEAWGFDPHGMCIVESNPDESEVVTADRILQFLELVGVIAWQKHTIDAMRHNFVVAHQYTCTEDWLIEHYPELFDLEAFPLAEGA